MCDWKINKTSTNIIYTYQYVEFGTNSFPILISWISSVWSSLVHACPHPRLPFVYDRLSLVHIMGLFCIFNVHYCPIYYLLLIIFLIYSQYLLSILFKSSLNVLLFCYGILSLFLLCTYFLLILLSYLYHLPPFRLISLPPSPQPVPSTHAPSRNPVCSLRRSLTVYYLGLASRSFLTSCHATVSNSWKWWWWWSYLWWEGWWW